MFDIGNRLVNIRKSKSISANKLATDLSVNPSTISKIENGNSMPSFELLAQICDYLNITLSSFFAVDDDIKDLTPVQKDILNIIKDYTPEQLLALKMLLTANESLRK